MLLKPRFSPLREAVLRERSRPPQGTPAPETASARSPRPLAVTPPPAPAPPAPATPRGPPPKSAARASPATNAGFGDPYVPSWRPPRPEKRLHPREGGLKFSQNLLVWPAAQALRSGGARPEATSAQSLISWSPIELLTSPPRFFDDFSLRLSDSRFSDSPIFIGRGSCLPLSARRPHAPASGASSQRERPRGWARSGRARAQLRRRVAPYSGAESAPMTAALVSALQHPWQTGTCSRRSSTSCV